MGPSQGNFFFFFFFSPPFLGGWRSGPSGRPVRADASWSRGGRHWLTIVLSGIRDAASSDQCEMCALHRDMDLGNYLPVRFYVCTHLAVFKFSCVNCLKNGGNVQFENLSPINVTLQNWLCCEWMRIAALLNILGAVLVSLNFPASDSPFCCDGVPGNRFSEDHWFK